MLFIIVKPGGRGHLAGIFSTNLAAQCRALKIEKLKAPLFRYPMGRGIQMTGSYLVDGLVKIMSVGHWTSLYVLIFTR